MNLRTVLILLALAWPAAAAEQPFRTLSVTLYQANTVVEERLGGTKALSTYLKTLDGFCSQHFTGYPVAALLDVVVAVKPSGASRVWIVPEDLAFDGREKLIQRLESVPTPKPKDGPIAFCIHGSVQGAVQTRADPGAPLPKAWQDVWDKARRPLVVPDDILKEIWKD